MKHIIISFNSRNSLLKFVRISKLYGISVEIINTPNSISRSCGLSAKTLYTNLNTARKIIYDLSLNDFKGIFYLEHNNFGERLQRLY